MATEHHNPDETPLEQLNYATDEPSPKAIATVAAFIMGFVVFCSIVAAVFLAIPGVIPHLSHPTGPFTRQEPPPGTPILQNNITSTTDIRDLRQKEDAVLATYGKASTGPMGPTYRIPIDKAIDLVASQHSLDPTENWLQSSSNPVPGDLSQTPSGPKADKGAPQGSVPQSPTQAVPANGTAPAPTSSRPTQSPIAVPGATAPSPPRKSPAIGGTPHGGAG